MIKCFRQKIKDLFIISSILFIFVQMVPVALAAGPIIDHNCTDLSLIPAQWIEQAKNDLHIAYQHTSHGSQLITGMNALRSFPSFGATYDWDDTGARPGALDLDDNGIPGCCRFSNYLNRHFLIKLNNKDYFQIKLNGADL